ncbi:uncharacterized protein VNE69_01183 [Vairimorpha necatrix]|uniref:Uncharacterized protein n=1 Tax=Vairimorpha necatrix TaxID=6039 RepID=A0AAX4J8F9_9MICR
MEIIKVIFLFVLVKTRHSLYENVNNDAMEKLKTGDFMSIDVSTPEKYLAISANFYEGAVTFGMSNGTVENNIDYDLGRFKVFTRNKSVVDIIIEMETEIELLFDVSNYYSIHYKQTNIVIKTIFCHLLLYKKVIDIDKFSTIIYNSEYSETKIAELTKKFLSNIRMSLFDDFSYLLTLCLLLETETYINENEFEENTLFGLLKEIGIVNVEFKNVFKCRVLSSHINLLEVFYEIANIHNTNYTFNNEAIVYHICKISALFTGLSSINIYYDVINDNINIKQDEIIAEYNLDKKDITKNNEIITKKLIENSI